MVRTSKAKAARRTGHSLLTTTILDQAPSAGRFVDGNFKIQIAFPEIFPLTDGAGVTSLWPPLFDVGRTVATNISRSTFPAQPVEFRGNDGGDLLGLAQLASTHMRTAISATTISQLIEMRVGSQVPVLAVPSSVPKLSRSGAPCRQLTP